MKSGGQTTLLDPRSIDPLDPVLPRSVGGPSYGGPSLWWTLAMAALCYVGPSLWGTLAMAYHNPPDGVRIITTGTGGFVVLACDELTV